MYFLLHSNIVIVKGKKRSLLMDLQLEQFTLIPNSMAVFIQFSHKKEKAVIYQQYGAAQQPIMDEYFEWLESKSYLFWVDRIELLDMFPPLPLQWDSPFAVTNIIVDMSCQPPYIGRIIENINACNIPFLQIRLYPMANATDVLNDFLALTKASALKGIEILMEYQAALDEDTMKEMVNHNIRIYQFSFYGAPEEKAIIAHYNEYPISIIYTTAFVHDHSNCGTIRPHQFKANMQLYMESKLFNTCLNRKIAIDHKGEIRNCPSMPISYGHIDNTTLAKVIAEKGFTNSWHIKKNKVAVCKDCEFRHVCTDCRAYLINPADAYSKPLKCGYNPYTNEWQEWSVNPLSKAAIAYYKLTMANISENKG